MQYQGFSWSFMTLVPHVVVLAKVELLHNVKALLDLYILLTVVTKKVSP